MSSGRFLGGLLIGGLLGTAIGMLIAPRKGEETREIIYDEISNRIDNSVEGVKSRTAELGNKARLTADQLRERSQQIASELEDTGRETLEKMRARNPKIFPSTES